MEIAKEAARLRGEDLAREAFGRAERLDPGNEDVIDFDPDVRGAPSASGRRALARLAEEHRAIRGEEALARLELARWLSDEAWPAEAAEEAREAFALAGDAVVFDEEGVLSTVSLGRLPKSLSLEVLEECEVFRGRLVDREEMPERIPWKDGWDLGTRHFRILTNVSGRLCRTLGRALEAAREIYVEITGWVVEDRISVYVIAERKAYEKFWVNLKEPAPLPSNHGKCKGDLCAVDGSRSERDVLSVTIHEVAHGYFNLGHEAEVGEKGVCMPPWYAEGFATYCAGYGPDSLSFDGGVVLPEIARDVPLRRFREELALGTVRPLESFMAMEQLDSLFYYQACALFWFFEECDDPDIETLLERAVKAMIRAKLTPENRISEGNRVFREAMGGDLSDLEERFFAWARSLELD